MKCRGRDPALYFFDCAVSLRMQSLVGIRRPDSVTGGDAETKIKVPPRERDGVEPFPAESTGAIWHDKRRANCRVEPIRPQIKKRR